MSNVSAGKEPPPKVSPESLSLRASPRPVKRLSRNALIGLLGVSAVLIAGAGLWALRPPAKMSSTENTTSTDHKPTAEGLAALPTSYANVSSPIPKLGPPLPGDLGIPIHKAEEAGALSASSSPTAAETAAETARQQRQQQAEAALSSGLFPGSTRSAAAAETGQATAANAAPPGGAATEQATATSPHAAFLKLDENADQATVSSHRLAPAASPYAVMAGTTISAALVTGLNSDLPGQVIATITAPVYDSATGQVLLIPQGARLLGAYDSGVSFGETRSLLVWTRLILPDGSSVVLDKTPATDAAGYAGVSDQVDNHWRQLVAGAAFTTLLGVGAELAAPENQTSGNGTVIVATREGLQDSMNQVGQELTRKNLTVKPTLAVRPGFPVRVLVNRDLVLEPYKSLN